MNDGKVRKKVDSFRSLSEADLPGKQDNEPSSLKFIFCGRGVKVVDLKYVNTQIVLSEL